MNIIELIRQKALKFLRLDKLVENPNSERLTFINSESDINKQDMDEARVWYIGDSNELLNYYTNQQIYGNYGEPIYNRNRTNYFWGISSTEAQIKRVHSGVPKAIVDTIVNVVGFPILSATVLGKELDLSEFIEKTDLRKKTMKEQLPMTCAIGWGAWKVEVDPTVSDYPILQFYEARNVEFIVKKDHVIGLIFKDYYSYKGKNYILLDTRRINDKGSSCIEYELFQLDKNNEAKPCELEAVPELADLKDIEIPNYRHILGVPCRLFSNPNNPNYGRSIYYGRYDLFDDLDQSLSQRSQTCRVSTPVEYYPTSVLERNPKNGQAVLPSVYNRQYVKKEGIPGANGEVDDNIQTTQPQLNFEQYTAEQKSILDMILIGILSPATLGIDVAKKDNGVAQREKEKVTLNTRDTIIGEETTMFKELVEVLVGMKSYIDTGIIPTEPISVSVKYSEFANPSFENLSVTLLPLWQAGAISDEMYINKLYGDSLSKEEKEKEILAIKARRNEDNLSMRAFESDGSGNGEMGRDLEDQDQGEAGIEASKQQLPNSRL